jgi:hypothetical protein
MLQLHKVTPAAAAATQARQLACSGSADATAVAANAADGTNEAADETSSFSASLRDFNLKAVGASSLMQELAAKYGCEDVGAPALGPSGHQAGRPLHWFGGSLSAPALREAEGSFTRGECVYAWVGVGVGGGGWGGVQCRHMLNKAYHDCKTAGTAAKLAASMPSLEDVKQWQSHVIIA